LERRAGSEGESGAYPRKEGRAVARRAPGGSLQEHRRTIDNSRRRRRCRGRRSGRRSRGEKALAEAVRTIDPENNSTEHLLDACVQRGLWAATVDLLRQMPMDLNGAPQRASQVLLKVAGGEGW